MFYEQPGVEDEPRAQITHLALYRQTIPKIIIFGQSAGVALNYFHFMSDALPSLLISMRNVRKHFPSKDFKVLIPAGLPDNCKEIAILCCRHLGFEYVHAKPFAKIYFKECVVTNYPTSMSFQFSVKIFDKQSGSKVYEKSSSTCCS